MADKPFPQDEAGVNLLLQTMATVLPTLSGVLGLDGTDVGFVEKQAANYQYMLNVAQEISDQREAFTSFKRSLFKGDPLATPPNPPVFPAISLPNPAANGVEETVKAIIKRIKASAGYNETIGEQLGLVDTGFNPISPDTLTAELKLKALSNSRVEIAFSKQGQDAMRAEFRRKGETSWTLAGIYTSSPGTHEVPSIPADDPESREYRGVLVKKNQNVGNYSPIYVVITTP